MLDCLSLDDIDEFAYKVTQDCDLTFDDVCYPPLDLYYFRNFMNSIYKI
jgi:hypothetical protein